MFESTGLTGPPCGTPSALNVTTPFSITLAFSHLFRSRISPPSLTRCRTNFLSHAQLTESNETATHYPPRELSVGSHDCSASSSTRGSVPPGPGLDAALRHAWAHPGAPGRYPAARASRLDRPGACRR